jgi:hypothetical protein
MNRTNSLITTAVIASVAATGGSMAQQERILNRTAAHPLRKRHPRRHPLISSAKRRRRRTAGRNRTETTGQVLREGQQHGRGERNSEQDRGKIEQPPLSSRKQITLKLDSRLPNYSKKIINNTYTA